MAAYPDVNAKYDQILVSKLPEPSGRFKQVHTSADKTRSDANAGWITLETSLKNEIMLRHYSPKTLKS